MTILITAGSLGIIALLSGVILFAASKKFAVRENPLIDVVEGLLPGANCGGCGYAGCRAFAQAFVESGKSDLRCPVASADTLKLIAAAAGIEMVENQRKVAVIRCNGGAGARREGKYHGINSCAAAVIGHTVDMVCPTGCIGYGDCIRACPFNCIQKIEGSVTVNHETCTGCGLCITSCPRQLIHLTPYSQKIVVACRSTDKGGEVKSYCAKGCIGCRLCEKACEFDAIDYQPFLAQINPDKCTRCGACMEKCPTGSIIITKNRLVLAEQAAS